MNKRLTKRALMAIAAAWALACASHPVSAQKPHPLPNGVWAGSFVLHHHLPDGSQTALGLLHVIVATCSGAVEVWAGNGLGKFEASAKPYTVFSGPDTHMFTSIDEATSQPDWVEIKSLTLLEVTPETAVVQWLRSVNNRDLPANDPDRFFFHHGRGELRREASVCDAKWGPAPVRAVAAPDVPVQ